MFPFFLFPYLFLVAVVIINARSTKSSFRFCIKATIHSRTHMYIHTFLESPKVRPVPSYAAGRTDSARWTFQLNLQVLSSADFVGCNRSTGE